MTISISPVYPAAGQLLTFSTDVGDSDVTTYTVTSTPSISAVGLGQIVTDHPKVARTTSTPLSYNARVESLGRPAAIVRADGSFVAEGYVVGMRVDISGTTNNDRPVTVAAVADRKLTLSSDDAISSETVVSSLRGATVPRGAATNEIVVDVPGEYEVVGFERIQCGGPAGEWLKLVATSTTTIHVGGFVELPIEPVNGHGTTLRLLVVNDTVRGAALVDPKTELARVAALDATVAASVAALVGVAVNSLDVDFTTDVNDICTLAAAHWLETHPVHVSADTTNTLVYERAYSMPSAMKRLNEVVKKHLSHQAATAIGGTWHAGGDDEKNVLQVSPEATSLTAATVLKADFRERVYRRHTALIASPASHGAVDSDNAPSLPVKTLPAVIRDYLDFIATEAPGAAAGEGEGIADAQAAWGFRAA